MIEPVTDIRYLERHEIDNDKWDQCIIHAPNGLIYARSFYLDTMSKNWSAIILNDYESVMPLTWNKKYGIAYLYQPPFTSQLGIFFRNNQHQLVHDLFIKTAMRHFNFAEIQMNFANAVIGGSNHANYVLPLSNTYEEIRKGFKKRLLENLNEAQTYNLTYFASEDFTAIITLFQKTYGKRFSHVRNSDYMNFDKLCYKLKTRSMVFIRMIKDEYGDLLNGSIFMIDDRRIYNIMSVSPLLGRKRNAHFFLFDQLIREFAGKNLKLDFEGSEIPGIATFYRKFGPVNEPFAVLRYNNLPFPLKLFK